MGPVREIPIDAQPALLAVESALAHRPDVMQEIIRLASEEKLTPIQLRLDDPDMPFELYEGLASAVGSVKRSSSFWLGDLLAFGEAAYGERFAQAQAATGLSEETLLDHLFVAKAVDPKVRKLGVPWGAHKLVARMKPEEQKAWLNEAAKKGLTVDELRKRIAAKRREDRPPLPGAGEPSSDPGGVFEVARAILRDAREHDDPSYFLIPREDIERLKAALGEETT